MALKLRALLLVLSAALSGCVTTGALVGSRGDADYQAMLAANAGSSRPTGSRTTGSRTQTIGLPLGRGAKIGLWTGVAVFLAYLMATDGEEEGASTADP